MTSDLEKLAAQSVSMILLSDPAYPYLLSQIYDPPPLLFVKGKLPEKNALCIAVVGSRNPTPYGERMAQRLGYELARMGVTVVSGMARGIDSAAHRGALEAGGVTVAVLGTGIDIVYPRENTKLAENIEEHGALLSEFPPGTLPLSRNFPRRNRIISGISHGVVVVEARERSGALITADCALDQGREVFAVPGRAALPSSFGTHKLLRDGAKLVEGVGDIIEEFSPMAANLSTLTGQNLDSASVGKGRSAGETLWKRCLDVPLEDQSFDIKSKVLFMLSNGVDCLDDIRAKIEEEPGRVERVLLKLELDGIIKRLPGNCYTLDGR